MTMESTAKKIVHGAILLGLTVLITLGTGALGAAAFLLYRQLHRRAERQRAEPAAAVAGSCDAIIGATLEGVVTSWNRGAECVFGHTAQQACGRHLAELIVPGAQPGEDAGMLERIGRGKVAARDETVRGIGAQKAGAPCMAHADGQLGISGAIGFNAAAALARCGGALDLYRGIALRFPAELEDLAARLRLSPAQPAPQETLALLHQIKGAASLVGAERLARLARHAERCLGQNRDERTRDAVEAVLLEVAPAIAAARQAAAQTDPARPGPRSPGGAHMDAASALAGLMPLLDSANLDALAYTGRLRTQRPPALAPAFDALAEAIDALQFTAALEQCASLLPRLKDISQH